MKVINRYPEIDIEWLVFGKGAMYKPQNKLSESNNAPIDSESMSDNESHSQAPIIPNLFNSINDDESTPSEPELSSITESKTNEDIITSEEPIKSEEAFSTEIQEQQKIEQISSIRSINNSSKRIVKLILLYSDNSFVEYHPN